MKATELRLNNFVRYAQDGIIFKVTEICNSGCQVESKSENTWIEIEEFEPIPLSEKWLEDFGFYSTYKGDYNNFRKLYNGDVIFEISYHDWNGEGQIMFALPLQCVYTPDELPINYVHQLQNLYFALTGYELVITPTTPTPSE